MDFAQDKRIKRIKEDLGIKINSALKSTLLEAHPVFVINFGDQWPQSAVITF